MKRRSTEQKGDMVNRKVVLIIAIAVAAIAVIAGILIITHHDDKDPISSVSYDVDKDDLNTRSSETSGRSALLVRDDKKAEFFMRFASAEDDCDHDGNSTVHSCYESLKKNCPSDTDLSEFILSYLQERFTYITDAEQYSFPDWAVYPVEMLSSMKGDCEDFSILTAALLKEAGYDCGIAVFSDHAVALVAHEFDISEDISGCNSLKVDHNGKTYYVLDASYDCPPGYTVSDYDASKIKSMAFI